MAMVLAMVVHGMGLLVKTLWGVQERRFSATFETLRSAAISMTTAFKPYAFGLKANRQSLLLRVKRNYADFNRAMDTGNKKSSWSRKHAMDTGIKEFPWCHKQDIDIGNKKFR
ncbi:hypothetical protein Golob_007628 [Gossypium lobatum]|uniref:Uncharacterized protein n=1 Tax=Gossypium lobatum TaxID=34289 RepID=A0A7J8MD83_9ROSI|nr:hypothetical protein [Gossypium lobatum]